LEAEEEKLRERLKGIGLTVLLLWPLGIIMLIIWIVQKINFKKRKEIEERRIKKLSQTAEEKMEEEEQKSNRIKREKAEFLKSQAQILSFLPADYQNLHAVGFMLTAVKNCRADTLKEAINLYESELGRLAMMDKIHRESQRQKMQAEALATALEEIAKNQESIDENLDAIRRQQYYDHLHHK